MEEKIKDSVPDFLSTSFCLFISQDPRVLWAKAEGDFNRMTDAQKVQTLVSAGLFTSSLKPAKPYRVLFKKPGKGKQSP
ncbi:MAG: hypothetical protein WCO57_01725 [Verrucomicrobiota bacterium]